MSSDLFERVERAVMETAVCGITIDGVRMVCCDDLAEGKPGYLPPGYCDCRNSARAAIAIALEEAAKVAEGMYQHGQIGSDIAAAIRKLAGEA